MSALRRLSALLALVLAVAGALAVAGSATALGVEQLRALARNADFERARDELQQAVQTDATLAPRLAEAQERQRDATLAHEALIWRLSLLLAAGAVALVVGTKWRLARKGTPAPPEERIAGARPGAGAVPEAFAGGGTEPADPTDLSFVRALVAREGKSREAAIPILQAIQAHYRYLPDEALQLVCELTEITPAQVAGTSSFYADFRRSPVGRHVVRVCHGTACHVAGARQITEELRRELGIPAGEDTDADRNVTVDRVACLGCCSLAPVLVLDERTAGRLTPADALRLVAPLVPEPVA